MRATRAGVQAGAGSPLLSAWLTPVQQQSQNKRQRSRLPDKFICKHLLAIGRTIMKRFTFFSGVLLATVCSLFVPSAIAQHEHPAGDAGKLGKVSFQVSCDPSVHHYSPVPLRCSILLVREGQRYLRCRSRERPHCGMAYWGIAMT